MYFNGLLEVRSRTAEAELLILPFEFCPASGQEASGTQILPPPLLVKPRLDAIFCCEQNNLMVSRGLGIERSGTGSLSLKALVALWGTQTWE